jgi:type IV secretion system protein VirB6
MGIATDVLTEMTALLDGFVVRKSAAMVEAVAPVVVVALTIYILLIGWQIARGHAQDTLPTLLLRVFRIALILALALAAGTYQGTVAETIDGLGTHLIAAVTDFPDAGAFLDNALAPYQRVVTQLGALAFQGPLPHFSYLIAMILVLLAGAVTTVIGLGLLVMAKVMLAVVLAVGPVFLFLAIFPGTQRYTEQWLGQALNYAFLNVLAMLVIAMIGDLGTHFLDELPNPPTDDVNTLLATVSLVVIVATTVFVMLNLNNLATALTGGISLGEVGRGIAHGAVQALQLGAARGAMAAGRGIAGLTQSATGQARAQLGLGPGGTARRGADAAAEPARLPLYQQAAKRGRDPDSQ